MLIAALFFQGLINFGNFSSLRISFCAMEGLKVKTTFKNVEMGKKNTRKNKHFMPLYPRSKFEFEHDLPSLYHCKQITGFLGIYLSEIK